MTLFALQCPTSKVMIVPEVNHRSAHAYNYVKIDSSDKSLVDSFLDKTDTSINSKRIVISLFDSAERENNSDKEVEKQNNSFPERKKNQREDLKSAALNQLHEYEVSVTVNNMKAKAVSQSSFSRTMCIFNQDESTTLCKFLDAKIFSSNEDIEKFIDKHDLQWQEVFKKDDLFSVNIYRIRCFLFMCGTFNIATIEGNHRIDCGIRLQDNYEPPFKLPMKKATTQLVPSSSSWYDKCQFLIYFNRSNSPVFMGDQLRDLSVYYQNEALMTINTGIMEFFVDLCKKLREVLEESDIDLEDFFSFAGKIPKKKDQHVQSYVNKHMDFTKYLLAINRKIVWFLFSRPDLTKMLNGKTADYLLEDFEQQKTNIEWFSKPPCACHPCAVHQFEKLSWLRHFREHYISLNAMHAYTNNCKYIFSIICKLIANYCFFYLLPICNLFIF